MNGRDKACPGVIPRISRSFSLARVPSAPSRAGSRLDGQACDGFCLDGCGAIGANGWQTQHWLACGRGWQRIGRGRPAWRLPSGQDARSHRLFCCDYAQHCSRSRSNDQRIARGAKDTSRRARGVLKSSLFHHHLDPCVLRWFLEQRAPHVSHQPSHLQHQGRTRRSLCFIFANNFPGPVTVTRLVGCVWAADRVVPNECPVQILSLSCLHAQHLPLSPRRPARPLPLPCPPLLIMLPSTLLPLLAFVALAVADPLHIPLRRRQAPGDASDVSRFVGVAHNMRQKYGYRLPSTPPQRRQGQTVNIQTQNLVRLHFI